MRKEKEKERIKGTNSGIGSVVVEEVEHDRMQGTR